MLVAGVFRQPTDISWISSQKFLLAWRRLWVSRKVYHDSQPGSERYTSSGLQLFRLSTITSYTAWCHGRKSDLFVLGYLQNLTYINCSDDIRRECLSRKWTRQLNVPEVLSLCMTSVSFRHCFYILVIITQRELSISRVLLGDVDWRTGNESLNMIASNPRPKFTYRTIRWISLDPQLTH